MTGKKIYQPAAQFGYIGIFQLPSAPSFSSKAVVSSGGGKRKCIDSFETHKTAKAVNKSPGGGSTSKVTKTKKAGGFVDKRSGNHGYKQEKNYKTSFKVNNKAQGSTTEYETQVKFKKTTTYHAPKKTKAAATPKTSTGCRCITYYDEYYYSE